MTRKELVIASISELPDEASLDDIAARVEFLAAVPKGLDQLDRGEGIPPTEVKRWMARWLTA
jgi:predicted transcriptional regulator